MMALCLNAALLLRTMMLCVLEFPTLVDSWGHLESVEGLL